MHLRSSFSSLFRTSTSPIFCKVTSWSFSLSLNWSRFVLSRSPPTKWKPENITVVVVQITVWKNEIGIMNATEKSYSELEKWVILDWNSKWSLNNNEQSYVTAHFPISKVNQLLRVTKFRIQKMHLNVWTQKIGFR